MRYDTQQRCEDMRYARAVHAEKKTSHSFGTGGPSSMRGHLKRNICETTHATRAKMCVHVKESEKERKRGRTERKIWQRKWLVTRKLTDWHATGIFYVYGQSVPKSTHILTTYSRKSRGNKKSSMTFPDKSTHQRRRPPSYWTEMLRPLAAGAVIIMCSVVAAAAAAAQKIWPAVCEYVRCEQ